jgi:hypothetical protein
MHLLPADHEYQKKYPMATFEILPTLSGIQGPEAADLYVVVALKVLEVGEVAGEKERRVILCTDALDEKEAEETEENEKEGSENASRFVAAYI